MRRRRFLKAQRGRKTRIRAVCGSQSSRRNTLSSTTFDLCKSPAHSDPAKVRKPSEENCAMCFSEHLQNQHPGQEKPHV